MAAHRLARSAPRRLAVVLTGVAAVLTLTAGAAFAYWTTKGTGTGTASAGTLTVTVNSVTVATTLYPGGSANLTVQVTNSASTAAQVTAVTAGTITRSAGCTAPAVTFSPGTLPSTIPAGSSSFTLTNAVSMGLSSSSDCQGATFTIPLTVAVRK